MGVPKFFRWLAQRCPQMIHPLTSDSIVHVDNLYLDMNGILHNCRPMATSEEDLIAAAFLYIEGLVDIVRPRKYLVMAVDGVAPRAKQNQQRQRRWRSYVSKQNATLQQRAQPQEADSAQTPTEEPEKEKEKETEIQEQEGQEEEQEEGGAEEADLASADRNEGGMDGISITPGTPFMSRLSSRFPQLIVKKMEENYLWQQFTVIFSGPEVPGEGEHKIMDFIRERRASFEDYSPTEIHTLYGLDADLIMLALATHEKHFTIFREYVNTGPSQSHRRSWRNRRKFGKPEETFQLLDVPVLRQWIYDEFSPMQPRLSFSFELDRLIDDFILTLFLCGNDFLPNVVSLDIGEGSLDYFFGLYREILPQLQGFITNTIHKEEGATPDQPLIHFERLSLFLNQLAAKEQEVINKRAKRALQDHNRRKGGLLKKLAYQFKLQQMEAKKVATAPSTTKTSSTASSSELMMELADFIQLSQCECLNNTNEDAFRYVLLGDEQGDDKELDESATVIVSDVDPQLIIKIAFKGKAKLAAIAMLGPSGTAPKNVRLYVDKPDLDFEACDDETPTHVLSFAEKDVVEEQEEEEEVALESRRHSLPATKFRSVSHLTIFIEDNQNDGDITKVTQLALYGVPLAGTDLSQLKQRGGASRHRRRGRRGRGGGAASQQGKATLPPLSDANKELVDGLEAQVDHEAQQDNVLLRSLKIPLRLRRYHPEDVEGTGASTTKHDEHVVDFAQYKRNYIQHALSNGKQSEGEGAVVDALLWAYIEGLFWIFEYYYHGCPSWEWFYPYHYGPFASDLANALQESWASEKRKVTFQMGEPLLPLQQLLCVLPPDKVELLPKAYRGMLHPPPSSPLAAFYPPPQHVRVDKNGKKNKWEYVLVLPFIDTKLLLKTLAQSMEESGKELLPEEQERNSFGCVRMLKWRGGGGVEEEQYPWLLSPSLPAAEEHNGQASGGTWQYRRR